MLALFTLVSFLVSVCSASLNFEFRLGENSELEFYYSYGTQPFSVVSIAKEDSGSAIGVWQGETLNHLDCIIAFNHLITVYLTEGERYTTFLWDEGRGLWAATDKYGGVWSLYFLNRKLSFAVPGYWWFYYGPYGELRYGWFTSKDRILYLNGYGLYDPLRSKKKYICFSYKKGQDIECSYVDIDKATDVESNGSVFVTLRWPKISKRCQLTHETAFTLKY